MVRRPRAFKCGEVTSQRARARSSHAHHQSNPRYRTLSSSSQKSRSLISLSSLAFALGTLARLGLKKTFSIKLCFSLARLVNIAWPVQKRNFKVGIALALSRHERKFFSVFLFSSNRKENTQVQLCLMLFVGLLVFFCTLLILAQ